MQTQALAGSLFRSTDEQHNCCSLVGCPCVNHAGVFEVEPTPISDIIDPDIVFEYFQALDPER